MDMHVFDVKKLYETFISPFVGEQSFNLREKNVHKLARSSMRKKVDDIPHFDFLNRYLNLKLVNQSMLKNYKYYE